MCKISGQYLILIIRYLKKTTILPNFHIFHKTLKFWCFFIITPVKIIRIKWTMAHFNQDKILYKMIYNTGIRIFLTTGDNFGLGYGSHLGMGHAKKIKISKNHYYFWKIDKILYKTVKFHNFIFIGSYFFF